MKKLLIVTSYTAFILAFASCASTPKAELPSDANPSEEVSQLDSQIQSGIANHYEVLDYKNFKKAMKYNDEAKADLQKGKSSSTILDEVAYGKSYFNQAQTNARSRRSYVEGLLKAREAALSAGVRSTSYVKDLEKIDDDLRSDSNHFATDLTTKEFNKIQEGYYDLELKAIQDRELAVPMAWIKSAEKNGAESNAPQSYKQAKTDLMNAKNSIAADRHHSSSYARAVNQSKMSARILNEVNQVITHSDEKTSEPAAIQIVMQRTTIRDLQSNLGTVEDENRDLTQSLSAQRNTITGLQSKQQMQEELVAAQEEFSNDEAEVFQRGDQLLIRLKKVDFASGSAQIPQKSMDLLARVKDTVMGLNPAKITVEGHTDATGSASKNKQISEKRAEAVAKFFESDAEGINISTLGAGFDKPIASNKTASGRAQNRRVDILVTPQATGSGDEEYEETH